MDYIIYSIEKRGLLSILLNLAKTRVVFIVDLHFLFNPRFDWTTVSNPLILMDVLPFDSCFAITYSILWYKKWIDSMSKYMDFALKHILIFFSGIDNSLVFECMLKLFPRHSNKVTLLLPFNGQNILYIIRII